MVGIAKNQTSLFESEIYRALERQAVKEGFLNPTEEQVVKQAAKQVQKNKLSGNVNTDIPLLISALREKGLNKQADNIENKFIAFKKAENGLYNLKTENLLEFAHPDGDVDIAPAGSDYGKAETVQSAAKKILDIVNKEPTGKVASLKKKAQYDPIKQTEERVQGAFNSISTIKNSLELDTDKFSLDNLQDKNVAQAYSRISGVPLNEIQRYVAIRQLTNSIFGNKYLNKQEAVRAITSATMNKNNIVFELAKLLGIDASQYGPLNESSAVSYLKDTFDPWRVSELIGLVPNEVTKNATKFANDVYMAMYKNFINVLGENRNKFDGALEKIKNSYNVIKTAIDSIELPPATQFVSYAQIKYQELSKFLNDLYNKIVNILKTDEAKFLYSILQLIAPSEFKKMEDYSRNLGGVFRNAVSSIPPEDSPMREIVPDFVSKLAPAVAFWKEKYESFDEGTIDKKNAGLNLATLYRLQQGLAPFSDGETPFINLMVALPKINEQLPDELPPQPLTQIKSVSELNKYIDLLLGESQEKKAKSKNQLTKQAGFLMPTSQTSNKPQGAGRPVQQGQPESSSQGRPTDEEKKSVINMQRLLGKFAQGLTEKSEELGAKLKMAPEQIRSIAANIGFTGKSGEAGEGVHDGKWGPNTINALKAAKSIAAQLGKEGEVVDGGVSYTKRDPQEVTKDARKNIEGLISIMREADMAPYLGEYNVELDYVPRYKNEWTDANADPLTYNNPKEGFVLMPEHVKSIRDFFGFVSSMSQAKAASSKVEFTKIAQEIQNSTIIRQNPYGEDKTIPSGSMSYNDFLEALKWFYNRSNLVYRTALTRQKAGEPNPLTGKPYTNRDIAIARSYHQQMQRLVSDWKAKYNDFFKEKGYVNQNDFIRAERGDIQQKPQGAGRPSNVNQPGQRDGGGYSVNVGGGSFESPLKNPPFDEFINIFKLIEDYSINTQAADWFLQHVKTGVMDRKEWRRAYVDEIADQYSKVPLRKTEIFTFLNIFQGLASSILKDVFEEWENSIQDDLEEKRVQRLYRMQNREKNRWLEILIAKKDEARRLLKV